MATMDGPLPATYLEPLALTLANLHPDRNGLSPTPPEPSIWIMPGAKD